MERHFSFKKWILSSQIISFLRALILACKHFKVYYRRNELTKKQFYKLVNKVIHTDYASNLGLLDFMLIKTYIILGSSKLYFKGMNKLFKTLLIK